MTSKDKKYEKPISLEEQVSFDEAMNLILNAPKGEVECKVQKEAKKAKASPKKGSRQK